MKNVMILITIGLVMALSSCSPRHSYVSHYARPFDTELGCREDCVNHKLSRGIPESEAVDTCTRSDVCRKPHYGQAIEDTAKEFADNFREHPKEK